MPFKYCFKLFAKIPKNVLFVLQNCTFRFADYIQARKSDIDTYRKGAREREMDRVKGGEEMKNRQITQKNLYLILPGKVSRMAAMYSADFGLPIIAAMRRIYASATYRELEDEKSKLWHYGPVALYQTFLEKH